MIKYIVSLLIFLSSNIAVGENLYIFTSKLCRPCRQIKLFINSDPDITTWFGIALIDIEDFPDLAKKYDIKNVPTSIIVDDDIEVGRIVGYSNDYKNQIINIFDRRNND